VRFQNIPTPWEVLEEAAAQLRGAAFYGHILESLERIWLGFAVATVLASRSAADWLVPVRRGHAVPADRAAAADPAVAWVPLTHHALATERSSNRVHHHARRVLSDRAHTVHRAWRASTGSSCGRPQPGRGPRGHLPRGRHPGALPSIVTGLSVGMGVSWHLPHLREMISGQFGVGYFTWVPTGS